MIYRFFLKNPEAGIALSFFVIILLGAFFLNLPWANHGNVSFLDAFFTSTSATCVTGLIVQDTGTSFTMFGHIVIMILIQLGVLEIIGAAALFFLALRKRAGIAGETFIKESLEVDFRKEAKEMVSFIFIAIFIFEALGAVFLFFAWNNYFPSLGEAAFSSLFHSISAFCNAGFSLFSDSLAGFHGDFLVNSIFCFLIFFGGLGFLTIRNLWQKAFLFIKKQKIKISFYSKATIIAALLLVFLGAFLFFVFEKDNLSSLSNGEIWIASFLQSINKTAGFNSVDMGGLSNPTIMVFLFLMFVGGAPTSATGGIKAIVLVLIIFFIASFFQGKEKVVFFRRSFSYSLFRKILVLITLCLFVILVGTTILLYTEQGEFSEILFEAVSAFGTVGWSMGLTPNLTGAGKVVIIILMYIGRIAPLAVAIIGSRRLLKEKVSFPEAKISLG